MMLWKVTVYLPNLCKMLISDSNYIKKKAQRNQQDQEAFHILEISLKAYSQMILKQKKGCICYEYYWGWIIHPAVLSSMRKMSS